MTGYYYLQRGLFDHILFKSNKPISPLESWIWLIEKANFEPGKFRFKSSVFDINRGSIATSYRAIAAAWNWSTDRVIRELKVFEKQGMIELETRHGFLLLTLCNYSIYQNKSNGDATATRRKRDSNATATSTNQRKGIKETKKPLTPLPECIPVKEWEMYKAMRQDSGKAITPNAEEIGIGRLVKWHQEGYDIAEIINDSIMNGYQGLFKPKGKHHANTTIQPKSKFDLAVEATERARARREQRSSEQAG